MSNECNVDFDWEYELEQKNKEIERLKKINKQLVKQIRYEKEVLTLVSTHIENIFGISDKPDTKKQFTLDIHYDSRAGASDIFYHRIRDQE